MHFCAGGPPENLENDLEKIAETARPSQRSAATRTSCPQAYIYTSFIPRLSSASFVLSFLFGLADVADVRNVVLCKSAGRPGN